MRFLFNLANHNLLGQRSLEDVIGIIGHQLRALGHTAEWLPTNDKLLHHDNGINVLVEGFTEQNVEIIKGWHAQGARFLVIATEEPTDKGFNHGIDPEMVRRQRDFVRVAEYCEGILHLVPGRRVTEWYAQHAPTAPIELGYAASLMRPASVRNIVPQYEFGFYGSVSKRRLKIMQRLAKLTGSPKAVRVVGDFTTQTERDAQMAEAKIILQIRKYDAMGLVSSSRCNTALCIGRPVLAEPHDLSAPWDSVVTFSQSMEHFYNQALLLRPNWKAAHDAQMSCFKAVMTPQACIGDALEQIGILDRAMA